MTTLRTAVSPVVVPIRCPEWCEVDADEHAAELRMWDGHLVHSTLATISDPTGQIIGDWPAFQLRPSSPIGISLGVTTDLDGMEAGTPGIILNGVDLTLEQALLVAEAIKDLVEDYVSHGGEVRTHGHDWRERFEVTPRRLLTETPPYEPTPDPEAGTR